MTPESKPARTVVQEAFDAMAERESKPADAGWRPIESAPRCSGPRDSAKACDDQWSVVDREGMTMKLVYRGHEISVHRERCMGGWPLLYYSIFRLRDGYECTSGFTEDESPVPTYVGYMKERIDAELSDADPWGEKRAAT